MILGQEDARGAVSVEKRLVQPPVDRNNESRDFVFCDTIGQLVMPGVTATTVVRWKDLSGYG